MKKLPSNEDTDATLRDVMAEIEALIEAIASEQPDCDMKLAELLEGKPEVVRLAIIKKLREMLHARAEEKDKELETMIANEQRVKVERQRGMFKQWLQWMMSEETIRKMREAFLAAPMMERLVRSVGHDMARRGMNEVQLGDKRDLGGLNVNVPTARGHVRGTDKGQGRE
jgi:hypothetical protein